MPIHKGHLALIEFASTRCDNLIVSLSYTPLDPIPGALRMRWLETSIASLSNVAAFMVLDDFDNESLPLEPRTAIWSDFIKRTYPKIDVVFSSESYGQPFANHLEARHISFDPARKHVPVSATMIRNKPLTYWDSIADAARPYFVKKICIYGPESTGKSTLTQRLAEHYGTSFVPEVAREMLITNDFTVDDIIAIGNAHEERINKQLLTANRFLFCDTDVITTKIYSDHYLGVVPEELNDMELRTTYALYFLLDTDVPWVSDGLRDLGDRREEMMLRFKLELEGRGIPYILVCGNFDARERMMVKAIDELLSHY